MPIGISVDCNVNQTNMELAFRVKQSIITLK